MDPKGLWVASPLLRLCPGRSALTHLSCMAFSSTGITGVHHHTRLVFVFLVEMGFLHVGQAGLELVTSERGSCYIAQAGLKLLGLSDPIALAFQSAGITVHKGPNFSTSSLTLFSVCLFFLEMSFVLVAQARVRWRDLGSLHLHPLGSSDSPASAFQVAGTTDTRHHTWVIFVFLVEMGSRYVGQADLELRSHDPPASASQSAGITDVSHRVWPCLFF
ncbi:hypothetical protein AAY473_024714 [Plecturocebus cupreus]